MTMVKVNVLVMVIVTAMVSVRVNGRMGAGTINRNRMCKSTRMRKRNRKSTLSRVRICVVRGRVIECAILRSIVIVVLNCNMEHATCNMHDIPLIM